MQKKNNKELSSIEDRKAKQMFVTKEENSLSLRKSNAVAIRGQESIASTLVY